MVKDRKMVAFIAGLILIASLVFEGSKISTVLPFTTWVVGFLTCELVNQYEEEKLNPLVYLIISTLYILGIAGVVIVQFLLSQFLSPQIMFAGLEKS